MVEANAACCCRRVVMPGDAGQLPYSWAESQHDQSKVDQCTSPTTTTRSRRSSTAATSSPPARYGDQPGRPLSSGYDAGGKILYDSTRISTTEQSLL